MGYSEFIIPYEDDEEKDNINLFVNYYKEKSLKQFSFLKLYSERYSDFYYEECEDNDFCDEAIEKFKIENPDIDFSGVDFNHPEGIDRRYSMIIKDHTRVKSTTVRKKYSKAIRVGFNTGCGSTFCEYLTKYKLFHYYNSGYTDYEVEEEYECVKEDSEGNELPDIF